MRICLFACLGLMASLSAQNLVYSNGPFQTAATGGGPTGTSPLSVLQTAAPISHTTFGYGAQQVAADRRVIDNFTVNSFMQVDEVEVFGYATGATAVSCTGVYLSLWDGNPSTGTPTQLITGAGHAVNLIGAAGFSSTNTFTNIYRVTDTATTGTTRNVQSVRVTLAAPLTLAPGTYWLEYSFDGINFVPALSTTNVLSTGDGIQVTTTVYTSPVLDGLGTMGFPFNLYSAVPAAVAGSITNLGGGCSAATMTFGGSPAVGGYAHADLSGVNPLAIPVIVAGVVDPNSPLFVCACTSHASTDFLSIGTSLDLTVPLNSSLVGVELFFQGAQLDLIPVGGITACNLGIQFDLTDGYSFKLNVN